MKAGLSAKMYPSGWKGVNAAACALAALFPLTSAPRQSASAPLPDVQCEARLKMLFTPPFPQLGRYEVCTSPRQLSDLVPAGWQVQQLPPLDALGAAGTYNRQRVAQLYGGRLALVARGRIDGSGQVESRTYISPHPDVRLEHLVPGTLIIRFIICCT